MSILVTNIQRQCFHDGPGLRTTVFLKGCSLHCPWCSNPENIDSNRQYYFHDSKCIRQGNQCIINPRCNMLMDKNLKKYSNILAENDQNCSVGAIGYFGTEYTSEQLYEELVKDRKYWKSDGGITLSGGEPLLQITAMEPLLKKLSEEKVHIAAETALFVPEKNLINAIKYIDFFYVDVKILISEQCMKILGGNLDQYLKNVNYLVEKGKTVVFRVPCIDGFTMEENNIHKLTIFLKRYKNIPVELLAGHDLGKNKYVSLGLIPPLSAVCEEKKLLGLQSVLYENGIDVKICQI